MSMEEYVHSHTAGHFALGVSGWIQSWATPAAMLFGGLGGKSGGGISEGAPRRSGGGVYDHVPSYAKMGKYEQRPGSKVNFIDMDALDRPETVDKLMASFAVGGKLASKAMKESYDRRILDRVVGKKDWKAKKAD